MLLSFLQAFFIVGIPAALLWVGKVMVERDDARADLAIALAQGLKNK